jgi:hypothetical protein
MAGCNSFSANVLSASKKTLKSPKYKAFKNFRWKAAGTKMQALSVLGSKCNITYLGFVNGLGKTAAKEV